MKKNKKKKADLYELLKARGIPSENTTNEHPGSYTIWFMGSNRTNPIPKKEE